MKKVISVLLILCMTLTLLLAGCTDTGNSPVGNNGGNHNNGNHNGNHEEAGIIYTVGKDKLPYSDEEIFEQLFDFNNVIRISIDISDEELLNIQKDYEKYDEMHSKSPIYREASMDITIQMERDTVTYHMENVGVRMKGNTSRTDFYSEEDGQYNLIHYRVKFMDGEFATLDCLELKWNRNDDSTYIREYYAYEMYRDMGVLAPHTNLASMDVADVHQGVFTIYEPVDKNFIEKYVDEKDQGGDLYKAAWSRHGANLTSSSTVGIEDEENRQFYNYDLKTNKTESGHEQMRNLINVLNNRDVTKEQIEEVVDMDSFLMFAAVSYFVGNPDDIRNNYNNYYIYFLKSSGKAVFIPYDQDRVFGVTKGYNPMGDGMTGVSPFSTRADGANEEQKNPLFKKTVAEGGYYVRDYTYVLQDVAESDWMTFDKFNYYYRLANANYSEYTTPGKTFWNAEHYSFTFDINRSEGLGSDRGNASFMEYLNAKMAGFEKYVN